MALLYDHIPFTKANGAHSFGPRNIPDGLTEISIRLGRCTTARPELWADINCKIAAQLYVSVDGGEAGEAGAIGYIRPGTLEEYEALVAGGMGANAAAAQMIAEGKLIFGAEGGIRVAHGVDMVESTLTAPLIAGVNRVVTGVLAVKGGPFVTELTIETL